MKTFKLNVILMIGFLGFSSAKAHCPIVFDYESQTYCLDVEWQKAEQRPQGQFVVSQQQSPILNLMTVPSQNRFFSKAHISVWKDGDSDHIPVYFPDLQIYPYMLMGGGHSHGARSNLYYDETLEVYVLSEMAFQEMTEGCWQIRLKVGQSEEQWVMNLKSFTNLTVDENYNQSEMCSALSTETSTHNPQHHHHKH